MKSVLALFSIISIVLILQLPKIGLRPARENVFERQAQTVGMARLYCLDLSNHPLASPQLPFGRGKFNMELSLFEWAEGFFARVFGGESCESVELVSQIFALVSAVLSLIVIYLLGAQVFGPLAGVLCAFALAFDSYWLKFSTYMLLDIRAVSFAFLGGLLCLKRKWFWACFAWFIAGTHRPQAFMALAPFFALFFIVTDWVQNKKILKSTFEKTVPLFVGGFFAFIYHAYSAVFNRSHDLPWFTWSGPRIFKTYFGDWSDRFEAAYWKSLSLEWFHKPALNLVFFMLVVFAVQLFFLKKKKAIQPFLKNIFISILLLSVPFLLGRFLYTFLFLKVVKWHDYYAIPLNGLGALLKGCILAYVFIAFSKQLEKLNIKPQLRKKTMFISGILMTVPLLFWAAQNIKHDLNFTQGRRDPSSSLYYHDWGNNLFPMSSSYQDLVVVVHPEAARDMGYLFISKHPGFTWCNGSPETAPRSFWQKQGVKYIAWPQAIDPLSHQRQWLVRTMDEELVMAREKGWSSDKNDYWQAHTMAEWSRFASENTIDPCKGSLFERNPQNWKWD